MTSQTKRIKPQRISVADLAHAARQGVERALAARAAMSVLTPEQITQVSGGVEAGASVPPIHGVVIIPPIHGVVIKPPIHGVVIKPPIHGVVIKPPVPAGDE